MAGKPSHEPQRGSLKETHYSKGEFARELKLHPMSSLLTRIINTKIVESVRVGKGRVKRIFIPKGELGKAKEVVDELRRQGKIPSGSLVWEGGGASRPSGRPREDLRMVSPEERKSGQILAEGVLKYRLGFNLAQKRAKLITGEASLRHELERCDAGEKTRPRKQILDELQQTRSEIGDIEAQGKRKE
jgi:hypothetical protein